MIWTDLVLSRHVSRDVIARALAESTGISDIRCCDSVDELAHTRPSVSCHIQSLEKGFPLLLSLYTCGFEVAGLPTVENVALALSRESQCAVLFDDGSLNPYLRNMVHCGGPTRLVSLNVALYDEDFFSVNSSLD